MLALVKFPTITYPLCGTEAQEFAPPPLFSTMICIFYFQEEMGHI